MFPRINKVKTSLVLSIELEEADIIIGDRCAQRLIKCPCCADRHSKLRYSKIYAKMRVAGSMKTATKSIEKHL
jgi:hypothetical protein